MLETSNGSKMLIGTYIGNKIYPIDVTENGITLVYGVMPPLRHFSRLPYAFAYACVFDICV